MRARPPNDTGGPPLPIFLINLNQSVGRLRKMEAQLDGDRWSRVSAVYGDNVWPGCLQDRHGAAGSGCAADTVGSGAQGTPRLHPRSAAVAFSHMRAWRKVEALPLGEGAAIVLEDDVKLRPGFAHRATELWRQARPLQPDLLHLYYFRHLTQPSCVHRLVEQLERSGERTAALVPLFVRLRCPIGLNTGTNAYVISRRGAARARQALLPLRVNTSGSPHASSFDLLLGRASMLLDRFALAQRRDDAATHDWKARSIRSYGLYCVVRGTTNTSRCRRK